MKNKIENITIDINVINEELSKVLKEWNKKLFSKFCNKYQLELSNNENIIKLFILKTKSNWEFLTVLWNYIPEKYEEIVNSLILELWDPILEFDAKNRSSLSYNIDWRYKDSDISMSVAIIIERWRTWFRYY